MNITSYDFDGNSSSQEEHKDFQLAGQHIFSGVVKNNNCIVYYKENMLHRIGGPAIENYEEGYKEYYIEGKKVSKIYHDLYSLVMRLKKFIAC